MIIVLKYNCKTIKQKYENRNKIIVKVYFEFSVLLIK